MPEFAGSMRGHDRSPPPHGIRDLIVCPQVKVARVSHARHFVVRLSGFHIDSNEIAHQRILGLQRETSQKIDKRQANKKNSFHDFKNLVKK
jgi:hypothetical protein